MRWSRTSSYSRSPWPGHASWPSRHRSPSSRSRRFPTRAISTRGSRPRSRASPRRSSPRTPRRGSPHSSVSARRTGLASSGGGPPAAAAAGILSETRTVLTSSRMTPTSTAAAEQLAELIKQSQCTVALTGAGISVPSGIPDFRTPGEGLWEKVNPMEVAHIDAFRRDPAKFWSFYRPRLSRLDGVQPNGAHEALAELERRGLLEAVITQNIDTLHHKAGSERVIEVHGSIRTASCQGCGAEFPLADVESLFDDQGAARCTECGGPLKPDVVLF